MRATYAAAAVSLLAAAAALSGCGDGGPKVTQTRTVGAFDRIEVNGSSDVYVRTGPRGPLQVTAGRKVIDHVDTNVQDGTLKVTTGWHGFHLGSDFGGTRVRVTVPSLRGVTIRGAGDVDLRRVTGPSLTLRIAGSGDVEGTGRVDSLDAEVAGSGDIRLADLAARNARVRVRGSGDSDLNVSDSLDVGVAGSGEVTYRGHPTLRSNIAGSGRVARAGDA
jgi:Putative auto-transporter adhesin, head GIN domain